MISDRFGSSNTMIRRNRGIVTLRELKSRKGSTRRHSYVHGKITIVMRKAETRKLTQETTRNKRTTEKITSYKDMTSRFNRPLVRILVGLLFVTNIGFFLSVLRNVQPESFDYKRGKDESNIVYSSLYHSLISLTSISSTIFFGKEPYSSGQLTSRVIASMKTTTKPRLVIHIGPPKTGSTSLQADLTAMQDFLRKDGFVYLGRLYKPYRNPKNGKIVINRRPDSPALTTLRNMFSTGNDDFQIETNRKDCIFDFRTFLINTFMLPVLDSNVNNRSLQDSSRRQQDTGYVSHNLGRNGAPLNILISDEALMKLWNVQDNEDVTEIWTELYESLTEVWDVTIVATYRRFFEWLPSAKAQRDKPTLERRRSAWVTSNSGGEALQPIFPSAFDMNGSSLEEMLFEWRRNHFLSDTVLNAIKAFQDLDSQRKFDLKIFHSYGRRTLTTSFLCNVLALNSSCQESRARDRIKGEATRLNSRDEAITSHQGSLPSVLPHSFYDAIATEAAKLGLINTCKCLFFLLLFEFGLQFSFISFCVGLLWWELAAWNRHQVAVLLQGFDATVRQRAREYELKHLELSIPLKCPTTMQLQQLLELSLRIEAEYMPQLFNRGHIDHKVQFQNTVESKVSYCWIDTDALLSKKDASPVALLWQKYIQKQFAGSSFV
jgi:hypothetical protein